MKLIYSGKYYPLLFFNCLFILHLKTASAQTHSLPNAHAHNDYKHKHPLTDALNCGFMSIEADIFLSHQSFRVAHVSPLFKKNKTLEKLYLKPLLERFQQNNGMIIPDDKAPITLLIDIKSNAEKTYASLKTLLEKYNSILTEYDNGKVTQKAVTIILTGNKPLKMIEEEKHRFAFIDESLMQIKNSKQDKTCSPLTSTKYSNLLKWRGKGAFPEDQKKQLTEYVEYAHRQGKTVRLWASPEKTEVWKELLDCGVDLINTDQLEELKEFLLKR